MSNMATLHFSSFYICSALLCISCLCYTLIQGRVARRQNQVYILLLLVIMFCATSSIVIAFFEGRYSVEAHFIADTSRFVSYVFHDTLTPMFSYYVLLVCGNAWHLPRKSMILYATPFLFSEIVILMNPLTDWVYFYDSTFQYCRNWGAYMIYIVAFFYMMVGLFNLFRYWYALTDAKRIALVFFIALVTVGIFIQVVWREIQIELFTDSLAALGLMLSIEDEDNRLDMATGTYNRRALIFDLENFFSTNQVFQIVFLRITDLESMPRVMGASASEALLRAIADYLRTILPPYCIYYANLSTYILLIHGADEEQAIKIGTQILNRFDTKWKGNTLETRLHAVLVRGMLPKDFPSSEEVLFMADNPLPSKIEKKMMFGRDIPYLLRSLEIERALRRGLESNTFEVYYQPIYESPSLRIKSAEALLRLQDPTLGSLSPAEFIPVAERTGFIDALGDLVMEEVCVFLAGGVPDELFLNDISVNLSTHQCVQPGFANRVKSIVSRFGVEPSKINFEITDSVFFIDYGALGAVIRELKEAGFSFSMGDYGAGYANMQSAFSLDFNMVKIDKRILWSADKGTIGRAILDNSVRMIRETGRKILVEGVETEEQLRMLTRLSVDYLQGFYFSKPMPKDAFIALGRSQQATARSVVVRRA